MAKKENETFVNVRVTDADGNNVTHQYFTGASLNEKEGTADYISETKSEEVKAEAAKSSHVLEVVKTQTFAITEADSLEELGQLFPNRALEFGNYGARLAQQNFRRDFMRDSDEAAREGAIDLAGEVQEARERKKASPQDKVISMLMKVAKDQGKQVTREQLTAMLAQFDLGAPASQDATQPTQQPAETQAVTA